MIHAPRLSSIALMVPVVCLIATPGHRCLGQTKQAPPGTKPGVPSAEELAAKRKRQDRREFQSQELMLAKAGTWIFKPGETPHVLWRDLEAVRRLGCDQPLRVRWFDAKLNESPVPNAPGRWLAWIEGTALKRTGGVPSTHTFCGTCRNAAPESDAQRLGVVVSTGPRTWTSLDIPFHGSGCPEGE